jgi:hypothetical protein
MLPSGQRSAGLNVPAENSCNSFFTPRATTTHTCPRGSPVRLSAEPASAGVRSAGVPPAAATVHT